MKINVVEIHVDQLDDVFQRNSNTSKLIIITNRRDNENEKGTRDETKCSRQEEKGITWPARDAYGRMTHGHHIKCTNRHSAAGAAWSSCMQWRCFL